jgi:hypothetical protein
MVNFEEEPHPWIAHRREHPPRRVNDRRVGLNGRLGLAITNTVGTMWAAYIFCALALISLPAALMSRNVIVIVAWIAQTFLQLVLLPIIIVGQNIQAAASDARAARTYKDAEAILHECLRLQHHLQEQDKVLNDLMKRAAPQRAEG